MLADRLSERAEPVGVRFCMLLIQTFFHVPMTGNRAYSAPHTLCTDYLCSCAISAGLEGMKGLNAFAPVPAAQGETGTVGHDAVILLNPKNVFHIEEDATPGLQKKTGRDKKCGVLKPDADAVTPVPRMEDDVVAVGYEIEKIMAGNGCGGIPGKKNLRVRFLLQLKQNLFLQRGRKPQNRICQKVDGAGRKSGDPDADFLHKMSLCAGK